MIARSASSTPQCSARGKLFKASNMTVFASSYSIVACSSPMNPSDSSSSITGGLSDDDRDVLGIMMAIGEAESRLTGISSEVNSVGEGMFSSVSCCVVVCESTRSKVILIDDLRLWSGRFSFEVAVLSVMGRISEMLSPPDTVDDVVDVSTAESDARACSVLLLSRRSRLRLGDSAWSSDSWEDAAGSGVIDRFACCILMMEMFLYDKNGKRTLLLARV